MNIITKDITTVSSPAIIIHGVNCQRTMQSGVAKALYTKWPHVKDSYMSFAKEDMKLGMTSSVQVRNKLYVMNCWTQQEYGYDQGIYADSHAIKECLESTAVFCAESNIRQIYSPRMGCGLGGLNWENDVQPILVKFERYYPNINITICDLNK